MEAMSSFFQSQSAYGDGWSSSSLKNFAHISPAVQTHLRKVHLSLCCALVASAAGAYLHILWNIGGFITKLGCLGSMFWILLLPPFNEKRRFSLLMAAAFLEGASIGPLIEVAVQFDHSILVSAFVGSAAAFGCFSVAAMLARRREYIYLGGLLSSALSVLVWLQFVSSVFGGSTALLKMELYLGLLVFLGYVIVDTQDIIEKACLGDVDCVKHALKLLTDFVAVPVRILVITNASPKDTKKKRRGN